MIISPAPECPTKDTIDSDPDNAEQLVVNCIEFFPTLVKELNELAVDIHESKT